MTILNKSYTESDSDATTFYLDNPKYPQDPTPFTVRLEIIEILEDGTTSFKLEVTTEGRAGHFFPESVVQTGRRISCDWLYDYHLNLLLQAATVDSEIKQELEVLAKDEDRAYYTLDCGDDYTSLSFRSLYLEKA